MGKFLKNGIDITYMQSDYVFCSKNVYYNTYIDMVKSVNGTHDRGGKSPELSLTKTLKRMSADCYVSSFR
jgi:hypothetical protein